MSAALCACACGVCLSPVVCHATLDGHVPHTTCDTSRRDVAVYPQVKRMRVCEAKREYMCARVL